MIKSKDNTASEASLNKQEFRIEEKQDYIEEKITRNSMDLNENSVKNHGNRSIKETNLIDLVKPI